MATKYITLTNLGTFLSQLKDNYEATDDKFGGIKIGYGTDTTNKKYPVQLDSGKAFVNVPWELGTFALDTATSEILGGINIGYNNGSASVDTNSYKAPLLLQDGKAYVNLIDVANSSHIGLMSTSMVTKLNNIDSYANNYTLPKATNSALGGIELGYNENKPDTANKKYPVQLDGRKAYVYVPADDTSSGGGVVGKKWKELVDLRDTDQLSPGTKYRITDYVATIGPSAESKGTIVAEAAFDIIVEALTTNILSENAKACKRTPTGSLANCNLDAWELKYCIDNDDTRFDWADSSSGKGKGVIYYMKDEWGNEAPYDFKGIKVDSSAEYRFTFTDSTNDNDLSLTGKARNNVIKPWRLYDNNTGKVRYYFNKISLSGATIEDNYFDYNCSNIEINGQSSEPLVLANKFNDSCDSIFIYGNIIVHNTFGNNCAGMNLGKSTTTTIKNGDEISYNTFGNNCRYITANEHFRSNIFGNNCNNFIVKHNFMKNVIGNNCSKWLFGHHCMKNTIVSNNYLAHWFDNESNPADGVLLDHNANIYNDNDYRDNDNTYNVKTSTFASIYYCENDAGTKMNPLCYVCNCVFDQNSHIKIQLQNVFISNNDNLQNGKEILRNYIFINLKNGFFDDEDTDNFDDTEKKILCWWSERAEGDAYGSNIDHCPDTNESEITYVSLNSSGKIIKIPSSQLFG